MGILKSHTHTCLWTDISSSERIVANLISLWMVLKIQCFKMAAFRKFAALVIVVLVAKGVERKRQRLHIYFIGAHMNKHGISRQGSLFLLSWEQNWLLKENIYTALAHSLPFIIAQTSIKSARSLSNGATGTKSENEVSKSRWDASDVINRKCKSVIRLRPARSRAGN